MFGVVDQFGWGLIFDYGCYFYVVVFDVVYWNGFEYYLFGFVGCVIGVGCVVGVGDVVGCGVEVLCLGVYG